MAEDVTSADTLENVADVTPADAAPPDVSEDAAEEIDVETPVKLEMLFCIDQNNPCLTDEKVPAEFVPFLSKCVYINDGSYLVNGLFKSPELEDFLDPLNLITVVFSGNKGQPQPLNVFNHELSFEPIEGEFMKAST